MYSNLDSGNQQTQSGSGSSSNSNQQPGGSNRPQQGMIAGVSDGFFSLGLILICSY